MAEYYAQRTQAGFLITEGTQIEPRGQGYAWTPGIYSPEQVAGWELVTDALHAKRRPIFAQWRHVGRVSHRALQPGHEVPIAPSAVAATGVNVFIPTGPVTGKLVPPDVPRALTILEIQELVEMYAQAARNALSAGFDVAGRAGLLCRDFSNTGGGKTAHSVPAPMPETGSPQGRAQC